MQWERERGLERTRVLVVDPDSGEADELAHAVDDAGARCVRVRGAEPIGTVAGEMGIGLVLLAWSEEDGQGSGPVRRVRELGYTGPVAAVLDSPDPDAIQRARQAGADDVLVRPVRPDHVRDAVGRWARSR